MAMTESASEQRLRGIRRRLVINQERGIGGGTATRHLERAHTRPQCDRAQACQSGHRWPGVPCDDWVTQLGPATRHDQPQCDRAPPPVARGPGPTGHRRLAGVWPPARWRGVGADCVRGASVRPAHWTGLWSRCDGPRCTLAPLVGGSGASGGTVARRWDGGTCAPSTVERWHGGTAPPCHPNRPKGGGSALGLRA